MTISLNPQHRASILRKGSSFSNHYLERTGSPGNGRFPDLFRPYHPNARQNASS